MERKMFFIESFYWTNSGRSLPVFSVCSVWFCLVWFQLQDVMNTTMVMVLILHPASFFLPCLVTSRMLWLNLRKRDVNFATFLKTFCVYDKCVSVCEDVAMHCLSTQCLTHTLSDIIAYIWPELFHVAIVLLNLQLNKNVMYVHLCSLWPLHYIYRTS